MSVGIPCPSCGSRLNRVVETRSIANEIRRRRACEVCRHRWWTEERDMPVAPPVVREPKKRVRRPRKAPAQAAPKKSAPPRQRVLDDLSAEEEFLNTDDDVRDLIGGIGFDD